MSVSNHFVYTIINDKLKLLFKHRVIWSDNRGEIYKPIYSHGIDLEYIEMLSEYNQQCICIYGTSENIYNVQNKLNDNLSLILTCRHNKHQLYNTIKALISSNINIHIDSINYFLFLISESDTKNISNKRKLSDMENYFNTQNKRCSN
jgi:hypothetical protein